MGTPTLQVVGGKDTLPTTPLAGALPTTPLAGALYMIARGFGVFPLKPNSKLPYTRHDPEKPLRGGIHRATRDPELVKDWIAKHPNINFGVKTEAVGIDCDAKCGPQWLVDLGAIRPLPVTLMVRTPSGGVHFYFSGEPCGQSKLAPTIDVRSVGGYLVCAGSLIDGVRSGRVGRPDRAAA